MRSDRDRLLDILEAIERIRRHTADGRGRFDTDELVQNWVVRHLEIVGEAASRLSDETREAMPDVPWRAIVGMRNVLVHGYFDIDRDAIWGVVDRDLDPLETSLWRHLGWEEASTTEQRRSSGGEDAAAPFHRDMVAGIATLKRELSYNPTRFAQMLGGYGGVGAAKRLLSSHEYSEGFTTLWEGRRLDLSVEAFVLLPWYRELFNEDERATAERRLREHGFDVEGFLQRVSADPPDWAT